MDSDGPMEYRVKNDKGPNIQAKSLASFFQGLPAKEAVEAKDGKDAKEAKPARAAQDIVKVVALGNAISQCGAVVNKVVELGCAEVTKIETCYPKIPSRNGELQVAQLQVTMKAVSDSLPPVSEEGYHEGKMKKVKKEGGKKGSELAGAADMGGIEYFTTTAETPEGDPQLLQIVCQEMNAEINPEEEESKGGSGRVAKCLLSSSEKQLALLTYVPKNKTSTITATEWMKHIIAGNADYGEIVTTIDDRMCTATMAQDKVKGKFPVKMRDECISLSIGFLKSKGLFPDESDDSDEMVFGDDDFPG